MNGTRHIVRLLPTILFVAAIVVGILVLKSFVGTQADVLTESIETDGEKRFFRLAIPKVLPGTPGPIAFAFHGVGDSTESMAAYSGLDRLAASEGCIVVYPEARRGMWRTVDVTPETIEENPDVRFFDRLLEQMRQRFIVDERRIFLVGMSNGGEFVQVLASVRPEVAGVVAHSATRPAIAEFAGRPFPVLMIVGEADPIADRVASDAEMYRAAGHDVKVVATKNVGHAWSPEAFDAIKKFLHSSADNEAREDSTTTGAVGS